MFLLARVRNKRYYYRLRDLKRTLIPGNTLMAFLRTLTLIVGIIFASIILPSNVAADDFQEGELTQANYTKWREHVLPRNWELSYRKIPWRMSFWDAVIEAQAREKPILLWAMNGHPLCNT
jgi:hypothetical protein|tara:strand:- start:8736 stop:9098 length:363 start_codon:yes stop_codon:yes gene_type:complete